MLQQFSNYTTEHLCVIALAAAPGDHFHKLPQKIYMI